MNMLAGYRTYILGGLIALQAVSNVVTGDLALGAALEQAPQALGGLGLMTLRAAVK